VRFVLGAAGVLALLVLTAPAAHADDCAFLTDCFYTVSTAAQVIAGVAVVVAASALALPAILRSRQAPSELSEAGVETQSQAHTLQAQTQAQSQGQAQAQSTASQQAGASAGGGGNQGLNLPNLPDTPDLPLTPAIEGMAGASAGEGEARPAREYSPQALEQMRALGASPADVERAIQGGTAALGSEPGTTMYTSSDGLQVLVEATTGRVLAVTLG
jgi:hypothetical protein